MRHVKYVYTRMTCFDTDRIYPQIPVGLRQDLIHVIHADLIKCVGFLGDSPRPFAAAVAPKMVPIHAPLGEFIFFEGEVCTHLLCMTEGGALGVARLPPSAPDAADGRRTVDARQFKPGDLMGVPALLLTSVYNVACVATESCALAMIPKEDLLEILGDFPDVHRRLYKAAVRAGKG